MKAGKLKESVLRRSVLNQLHMTEDAQLVRPSVGTDFGAIQIKDEAVVTAVETRVPGNGILACTSVYAACNNLVCSGARPLGITVNFLVPTESNEQQMREQMQAVDEICVKEQLPVLSGHTEVVRNLKEPFLTVTAVGTVSPDKMLSCTRVKPGMDILVTKYIALEGTAVLAAEHEEQLRTRFAQPFLDTAKSFIQYLSIRPEAKAAAQSGAVALHDLSEGGIYAALWEMGQGSGVGLTIDLKKIPLRQETVEICEYFDLNPYKLLSGGSLLIAAENGHAVAESLKEAGIEAVVIGKTTDSNDRVLVNGEECRFLETAQTDELWRI